MNITLYADDVVLFFKVFFPAHTKLLDLYRRFSDYKVNYAKSNVDVLILFSLKR